MELVVKRFQELTVDGLYDILRLRPYPEIDGNDRAVRHVFLREDGRIKAYLRVLPPHVIFDTCALGRVVAAERRRGLASRVLAAGIEVARREFGAGAIMLEAQTYARGHYEKAGFRQVSEKFLEDGIPHIRMRLELPEEEIR